MKKFVIILSGLVAMMFFMGAALGSYLIYEVFAGNYDHLDKSKILDILSRESVVYYADGQTQLGSLFGTEHRHYVPLKEMPKYLLDAAVASEDDSFYRHIGIDFVGTVRAAVRNILFRKREGASTITQQTVKNLYGRPVTNMRTKFVEAINAFKLERKYSKQEILEFYLNQFHVTGNGRGVGIAAKYYFDKDVIQLSLTEAAFIVGSVKGPERYNPFTKRSLEAQNRAKSEAKNRKNYVLRRMLENKFITEKDFNIAKDEEVPFKQGKFQFNELFITEIVRRQIGRPEVLSALGVDTVDALGSMGLRITTTVEKPVQTSAQYGVRQNLSRLEMILHGFEKESPKNFIPIQRPEKYQFYVSKIKSINKAPKNETLELSMGVPECQVTTDGVDRVANITDQAFMRGLEKSKREVLSKLAIGDFVLASVRDILPDGKMICDLERRPRIQGALIVLDKGKVVAMVGGYSPHEFNRAVFAKRQPGSTFKTLTYYPALQMGWHALEPLLNTRNVYTWQGQFYYPRPDHVPESIETTFIGAGAKSENLASIWLLAHLLDRLTFDQFKDLLEELEVKKPGETDEQVIGRAANVFNVKLNEENLRAGVFNAVKADLVNDVTLSRSENLRAVVRSMNYGTGFSAEIERVQAGKGGIPAKERVQRTHVLRNNFLRWQRVRNEAVQAVETIKKAVDAKNWYLLDTRAALSGFRVFEDGERLAYMSIDAYEQNPVFSGKPVYPYLPPLSLRNSNVDEVIAAIEKNNAILNDDNVYLDGVLPLGIFKDMEAQVNDRYAQIANAPPLEKLYWHDDFRYSLGMLYAARMVHEMGVDSELQWVPSFPLGANVVTLAELALAYQTIIEGRTYRYFETPQENQLLLVQRIEDSQGQLLWEASPSEHQLIDKFYSVPMLSVLRGTVTNGTGRTAHNTVMLRSNEPEIDKVLQQARIRIPTFGKTGTTNDYVNATYVGFLPYPAEKGATEFSAENMYTIAAYVGYDTNEPMRRRGFKVQGGSGALPAWIETALALVREEDYAGKLGWKSLVEKKVSEIPFDYEGVSKLTVPIHAANVAGSGEGFDEDKQALDTNKFIDDYATSKTQTVRVALPGSTSDDLFKPQVKVSFFKPRQSGGGISPQAKDASAQAGVGEGVDGPEGVAPKVKPNSLEDNLEDLKFEDIDLNVPPPPPDLRQ